MTRTRAPKAEWLLLAAAAWLAAGCGEEPPVPQRSIGFYVSSRRDVLRARRVVLVELTGDEMCPPQVAWDTTEALLHAVGRKQLFHLDVVRRSDPMCRDLPLDRLEALTMRDLADIRQALHCDAVLFGRISQFQPYPRMQLALYLKLIDLKDGKLIWGLDHLWDTTDRTTDEWIGRYYDSQVRGGYEPMGVELIHKSPRAFEKFVAYEAAETLPAAHLPPPAAKVAAPAAPAGPAEAQKASQPIQENTQVRR